MIINFIEKQKKSGGYILFLGIASFFCSFMFTLMMLLSDANTRMEKFIFILVTIIFECGKFFAYKEWKNGDAGLLSAKTARRIWLVLVIISILSSMAWYVNQMNIHENDKLLDSAEYKAHQDKVSITENQIVSKQSEIDSIIAQRDKDIAEHKSIKDNYPSNYLTMKANEQAKMDKIATEAQGLINNKLQEKTNLENELKGLKSEKITTSAKDISGNTALFGIFTSILSFITYNLFGFNVPVYVIPFVFTITVTITLEYVGCWLITCYFNFVERMKPTVQDFISNLSPKQESQPQQQQQNIIHNMPQQYVRQVKPRSMTTTSKIQINNPENTMDDDPNDGLPDVVEYVDYLKTIGGRDSWIK